MRHATLLTLALTLVAGCGVEETLEVGARTGAVIGGSQATPGEWPWQAQIRVAGSHNCGGTLIASRWVLTAGHCAVGQSAANLTVVLGEHDQNVTEGTEQTLSVAEIVIHPQQATPGNDVALLRLTAPASLRPWARVVGLARGNDGAGLTATVTGWGNTSPGSGTSRYLMEAPLPVQTNQTCDQAPGLSRDLTAGELCAGFLTGTRGGCHGDSGGPLVVSRAYPRKWEQIGIVSWGRGYYCDTYTVFARVSSFAAWIRGYALPFDAELHAAVSLPLWI